MRDTQDELRQQSNGQITFFPVLSVFGTEFWVKRLNRILNYDVSKEDMKCLLLKLLSESKT